MSDNIENQEENQVVENVDTPKSEIPKSGEIDNLQESPHVITLDSDKPKGKTKEKTKQKDNKYLLMAVCVAASFILGFAGGFIAVNLFGGGSSESKVTKVVDDVDDSVVEIDTQKITVTAEGNKVTASAGSGIIISSDGYIVTNRHVIQNAIKVNVTLKNSETYTASLVGYDSDEDIAVIKINKTGLVAASFGDSSKLKVGQTSIVIGNALGLLEGSVSSGIISAKERELSLDGENMVLFQTDAAINGGSSGGGIFDISGKLIGMVIARSTASSSEGLGFGIPANTVKYVTDQIMKYGYVPGRITLQMQFTQTESGDIVVANVLSGSGAESAGFKVGDVITEVKHKKVYSVGEIDKIVDACKVGDVIDFTVMRNEQTSTISLTLVEFKP